MNTVYKILSIVILGIVVISSAFGAAYLIPGLHTDDLLQGTREGTWEYRISGEKGGAGSHTKSELIFTRTMANEPRRVDSTELTKDLHYTDLILFWDWKIHTFENYVFVTWITSEQSWSDVFLAVSDDYGKTFEVKNISQSKEYVHQYKVDYSGETIYFGWQHEFITENNNKFGQIYFTKSDNFGESFGQQKLLSTLDKPAYEFDLEAFGDNVFVAWRQEFDLPNDKNIWFATSTNKAEYFEREPVLLGAHVDAESFENTLYLTWVSVEDDTQIWYSYSEDLGKTLHSRIVFDADWKLSPYAPRPVPQITIDDDILIEFEMDNQDGIKTPYQIRIGSDSESSPPPEPEPIRTLTEVNCFPSQINYNDECIYVLTPTDEFPEGMTKYFLMIDDKITSFCVIETATSDRENASGITLDRCFEISHYKISDINEIDFQSTVPPTWINIKIKDLTRNVELGSSPTFQVIESGWGNRCTHPTLEVYHMKQEIGNDYTSEDLIYKHRIVYSCPWYEDKYPPPVFQKTWDESDFPSFPVCEKQGRYLIIGDSGYERMALEDYHCGMENEN